jgi:putative ATP-binding cassette transporter
MSKISDRFRSIFNRNANRDKSPGARKPSFLGYIFNPQTAIEDGWKYQHAAPKLSDKKKKELMEASSLETPRSTMRAVAGILAPYWTKSSLTERAVAATLLSTSLFMTWYAVQVTVEFGHWQSGLTNTIQQMVGALKSSRPEIIADTISNFPLLDSVISSNPLLESAITQYPDTTSILYSPQFREIIGNSPELSEILQSNPTIEEVLMQFPAFKEQVSQNPELLTQLGDFSDALGEKLSNLPQTKELLGNLGALSGGDFLTNWGNALSATFNSAASAAKDMNPLAVLNEDAKQAWSKAWYSKDLATIALKFTGMAIISYKSAQHLALRWRAWTTGYFTNKWTTAKAYSRLKNSFNNIDNPGQRIQEDPAKFTAGAVSLMTGVMSSAMTFGSFFGMLWGMGSVLGVPHGMAWLSLGYAGALTALTVGAGYKLPWIQRNQQRREADFRASIDKIHNNADLIAQNGTENVENELVKKRFKPVMKNSLREIGTQVKLIIVDATAGNLSIPIPYIVGAFAVAAGTASMGTIQTLNYAFNRVTSSLSFIVNRFEQLSHMKATADRIYTFDRAIEAAHYIEEEKRQKAQKLSGPSPAP